MTKAVAKFFVLILVAFAFVSASCYTSLGRSDISANQFTKEPAEVAPLKIIGDIQPLVVFLSHIDLIQDNSEDAVVFEDKDFHPSPHVSIITFLSSDTSPPLA